MEIDEIREKRTQLEQGIFELINSFERATGTSVEEIELERRRALANPVPILTRVCLKLNLNINL